MRTRFIGLLAAAVFLLLMLPAGSLALVSWAGTGGTYDATNGWTHSATVQLTYQAVIRYTENDIDGMGHFQVKVGGDVTLSPLPFLPDREDIDVALSDPAVITATCSGDVSVPLTPGDGEKRVVLQYLYTALVDGVREVTYRSAAYSGDLVLDTHGPKTLAPYPLSCRKGGYATITYEADDALSPTADISLLVTNARGKKVTTVSLGEQQTGEVLRYLWKCPLAPGAYKYSIRATDLAGNEAAKVGKNRLTVR